MESSTVAKHFDKIADKYDFYKTKNKFYYDNLKKLLGTIIPKNSEVLEIGCGTGDLIAHLRPKKGFGQDISKNMIAIAKKKHKNIHFGTDLPKHKFDYIFMSDVVEHLENPEKEFREIAKRMTKDSLFVCTMANPIWEPVLMVAEKLGLKMPEGKHKRIGFNQIETILNKSKLKLKTHGYKLLVPVYVPVVSNFINKFLERPLRRFAFIEYFTATKF